MKGGGIFLQVFEMNALGREIYKLEAYRSTSVSLPQYSVYLTYKLSHLLTHQMYIVPLLCSTWYIRYNDVC